MRALGLSLLTSLLLASSASAGTIQITFVLTAGSGSWISNQSGGVPVTLGSGSVFFEIPGTSALSPTGSVATIQQLFATGLGQFASANSLQLFALPGQVIATHPGGITASAGAGTLQGWVGGPTGVIPLMSFAAVLFDVSNLGTSGAATFRLLNGNFGGASAASISQTFIGTEVSRTYVPEPGTGLLVALGLGFALASLASAHSTRRSPDRS